MRSPVPIKQLLDSPIVGAGGNRKGMDIPDPEQRQDRFRRGQGLHRHHPGHGQEGEPARRRSSRRPSRSPSNRRSWSRASCSRTSAPPAATRCAPPLQGRSGIGQPFPITEYQSEELLLDNRHLWIRSREQTAVMKVKATRHGRAPGTGWRRTSSPRSPRRSSPRTPARAASPCSS